MFKKKVKYSDCGYLGTPNGLSSEISPHDRLILVSVVSAAVGAGIATVVNLIWS